MKSRMVAVLTATIGFLLVSGSAFAHHSDAEFDLEQVVTFQAAVIRVQFINPHMLIHFEVKNSKGDLEQWISYGGPPNRMARVGWTSQTIKPGEQLTIYGLPSKYGRKTMLFVKLVRANGKVIPLPHTLTGRAIRKGLNPEQTIGE